MIVGVLLALATAAPASRFEQCKNTPFEGITQTTADGEILGEPDAHDWGCIGTGGMGAGAELRPGLAEVPPTVPSLCFGPAFPNPAQTTAQIRFTLPQAARLTLTLYSQRLRRERREVVVVRTLADGEFAAGVYAVTWDLKDSRGARVASGVYRAILVVGDEALCGDIEIP
jgi:hypothetical protein